jgi:hypothetical protein
MAQSGTAFDPNFPSTGAIGIWDIRDGHGTAICQFDHDLFPTILHGAAVKFVDDDAFPGMAEEVWAASQVDPLVRSAVPDNGATTAGLEHLERYVMRKLGHNAFVLLSGGSSTLTALNARLGVIRSNLNARPDRRATVPALRHLGV